jgi:hypothetical protein
MSFILDCSLEIDVRERIANMLNDEFVTTRSKSLTVRDLRGIIPALPGRITSDFEEQIEQAMDEEAERIVADMQDENPNEPGMTPL